MNEKNPEEKRKYTRIKKNFILTYYDLTDPSKRHDASQLKNISLGGICLITGKPYPPGTHLGIELKTPFLSELTHLEGLVLESHTSIHNIIYETRVKFTQLPNQSKFVLQKLIEHFEKRKSENDE